MPLTNLMTFRVGPNETTEGTVLARSLGIDRLNRPARRQHISHLSHLDAFSESSSASSRTFLAHRSVLTEVTCTTLYKCAAIRAAWSGFASTVTLIRIVSELRRRTI